MPVRCQGAFAFESWTSPKTTTAPRPVMIPCLQDREAAMAKQAGFWSVEDRLAEISAGGDPLDVLDRTVEFARFRPILERAVGRPRGARGGRPAMDVVLKFRMLVL